MRSIAVAIGLALPIVTFVFQPAPAKAEIFYPWCLRNAAGDGVDNCAFDTLEQCRMSLPGSSGTCVQNIWYTQPQPVQPAPPPAPVAAPPPAPVPAPQKPKR